jgi:hypothetical protein
LGDRIAKSKGGTVLSKLIVASYALLLEISLWLALAAASITGYEAMVPMMQSAGVLPGHEFAWKIIGALAFPVVTFLILAMVFGPVFLLLDLRNAVRNIEAKARGEVISWLPERKEPT